MKWWMYPLLPFLLAWGIYVLFHVVVYSVVFLLLIAIFFIIGMLSIGFNKGREVVKKAVIKGKQETEEAISKYFPYILLVLLGWILAAFWVSSL